MPSNCASLCASTWSLATWFLGSAEYGTAVLEKELLARLGHDLHHQLLKLLTACAALQLPDEQRKSLYTLMYTFGDTGASWSQQHC